MIQVICKCNIVFYTYPSRIKSGRGIYCSKDCMYKYSIRPKGLIYNTVCDMGAWNRGKKLSPEHRAKVIKGLSSQRDQTGNKNPSWKGGVTPIDKSIRMSSEYKLWRKSIFIRDNYTCVFCGNNHSGNLQADYIKPFAYFPNLRFELSNGRTLCITCCITCHRQTPTYGNKGRLVYGN